MNYNEAIGFQYRWVGESAARIARIDAAAKAIKLEEALEGLDGYIGLDTYGDNLGVRVDFYTSLGLTPAFELTESNPLQVVAQRLLPIVGTLVKGFNDTRNEITLSTVRDGVTFTFSVGTPNTCTVEKVEEEVEVAEKVIPAHTEKKVRYVLKGDCDPLMKPVAAAAAVPSAVLEDSDIPF